MTYRRRRCSPLWSASSFLTLQSCSSALSSSFSLARSGPSTQATTTTGRKRWPWWAAAASAAAELARSDPASRPSAQLLLTCESVSGHSTYVYVLGLAKERSGVAASQRQSVPAALLLLQEARLRLQYVRRTHAHMRARATAVAAPLDEHICAISLRSLSLPAVGAVEVSREGREANAASHRRTPDSAFGGPEVK
jgi:hypothetical protein